MTEFSEGIDGQGSLDAQNGAAASGGRELALARIDPHDAPFGAGESTQRRRRRAPSALRRVDPALALASACLLGLGWLIGASMNDRRSDINRMQGQIRELSSRLSTDTAKAAQPALTREARLLAEREAGLRTEFNALKGKVDAAARQAQIREADLAATIAKAGKDPRFAQLSARLDRIEKQVSSPTPTGSIGPVKTTTVAGAKPAGSATVASKRPPNALKNFAVRGVDRGVALVEADGGLVEVAPGDYLDGAGRIERFERRSGRWVVLTSKGVIASDD